MAIDYSGYPSVECPDCGASDTVVRGPVDPFRHFGVGEWAHYTCNDCSLTFDAIVPEPADGFEGDGIYASNH